MSIKSLLMAPVVLQVLPYKWKPGEGIGDFSFHSLKDALLQSLHHSAEWKHYLETPNRFCQHWSILVCPFLDFNWCWQSSQWWWLGKKKNCFFFPLLSCVWLSPADRSGASRRSVGLVTPILPAPHTFIKDGPYHHLRALFSDSLVLYPG